MKADLRKHTLHLREGDWDFLESICKPNGIPTSLAVRTLVSNYVDRKRQEEAKNRGALPEIEIDL